MVNSVLKGFLNIRNSYIGERVNGEKMEEMCNSIEHISKSDKLGVWIWVLKFWLIKGNWMQCILAFAFYVYIKDGNPVYKWSHALERLEILS